MLNIILNGETITEVRCSFDGNPFGRQHSRATFKSCNLGGFTLSNQIRLLYKFWQQQQTSDAVFIQNVHQTLLVANLFPS